MRFLHAQTLSRRRLAAASATGLIAGVSLLAVPAHAESAPLNYTCAVPILGSKTFVAVVDTDAPASIAEGATQALNASAKVTVPEDLVNAMRGLGTKSVYGSAPTDASINGVVATNALTIAKTPVPATGPLVVLASGVAGTLPAGTNGATQTITAGNFTAILKLDKEDGSAPSEFTIPCTLVAGQNATIDTVPVSAAGTPTVPTPAAKAATTTKLTAKHATATGKATVKALVKAADASSTAGKITLVLKKGTRKIKSITTTVSASGAAKAVFKKITKTGKYTVTGTFAGSTTVNPSTGKVTFKVK